MTSVAEVWKQVIGNPFYQVSNLGRVRSIARTIVRCDGISIRYKSHIMSQRTDRLGYFRVNVPRNTGTRYCRVHQLVASSFIGPRPHGLEVNHVDGDKANNHSDNLEYITHQQNMQHAVDVGLKVNARGEEHYNAKITEETAREIHRRCSDGELTRTIAETFDVTRGIVQEISLGKSWKHLNLPKLQRTNLCGRKNSAT